MVTRKQLVSILAARNTAALEDCLEEAGIEVEPKPIPIEDLLAIECARSDRTGKIVGFRLTVSGCRSCLVHADQGYAAGITAGVGFVGGLDETINYEPVSFADDIFDEEPEE